MVDRPQALVLTYPHLFWTNVGGIQDNVADHMWHTQLAQINQFMVLEHNEGW